MTHMHIPDGILPFWLWGSGYLAMAAILAFCLYRLRNMDRRRMIPLLGAMAAVMLVTMSIEVLPIAYHLNLSVATGILLGPALGFVAACIVNVILAFLGHGGITVIGLNTLLLGAEAMLGHAVFYLLPARISVFKRAFAATVLALFVASLLLIGIVAVSHINAGLFLHPHETAGEAASHATADAAALRTFAITVLALGLIGWIIEGAITGAVIRFISRVRPDLLRHVLHDRPPLSGGKAAS